MSSPNEGEHSQQSLDQCKEEDDLLSSTQVHSLQSNELDEAEDEYDLLFSTQIHPPKNNKKKQN